MRAVIALARKDLKLLLRQKAALFWVVGWPLIMAVMFGFLFGGGGGPGSARPRIAVADLDDSTASRDFVARLGKLETLEIDAQPEQAARELVRTAKRSGAVIVPKGFGAASQRLFYGEPPVVDVVIDPARQAERAMLEGMLQQIAGAGMGRKMTDPAASRDWLEQARGDLGALPAEQRESFERFFDSLQSFQASTAAAQPAGAEGPNWAPLTVRMQELEAQRRGPRNGFAVTFPQGLLWGIVGCIMTFASALVLERVQGTFARLCASPLTARDILLGKALACIVAIVTVGVLLFAVSALAFGVRPQSWPLLLLALLVSALGFTGLMMLIASFGRTVESVSGAGWAAMMPLMLLGGGMIPLFIMPAWVARLSDISPVKWAVLAFEGALWRGFSLAEMAVPFAVLLGLGAVGFVLGSRNLARNAVM